VLLERENVSLGACGFLAPRPPVSFDVCGHGLRSQKPIPEADPVAYARMKFEVENRKKAGIVKKALSVLSKCERLVARHPEIELLSARQRLFNEEE
jgi:hypothetical protein